MNRDYGKIVRAFKSRKKGATVADIVSSTGLPMNKVRELIPKAADEFKGRLEVTESGEILYSFPNGFTSRYRGFIPFLNRYSQKTIAAIAKAGTFLFKIWIMVMLVGYFILFMAIAVASLVLSAAASSNNRSRGGNRDGGNYGGSRGSRGGMYSSMMIFNLIIRLWFASEMTRSFNSGYGNNNWGKSRTKSRPLYKAIFSFVFGDGDPNANWEEETKKAFIAHLKENRGVISLPEFMILGGYTPVEAESKITSMCVEFEGSPEATNDGTIVYRFDKILLGSEKPKKQTGLPLLFKNPVPFSSNPEKMNFWFGIINGVNLAFGSYFLYSAATVGRILTETKTIYGFVHEWLSKITDPLPVIITGLGIIPVVFSILFWLIPMLRSLANKKKNRQIRFENFRKFSFSKIWNSPLNIKKTDLDPVYKEAIPAQLNEAQDHVLKEMGVYDIPDIKLENNKEIYTYAGIEREKEALKKYRSSIIPEASSLGNIVFDSDN